MNIILLMAYCIAYSFMIIIAYALLEYIIGMIYLPFYLLNQWLKS